MRIVALDLFCGCGGVTYGLTKAGVKVALGVDNDEDVRLTYTLNNPGTRFICSDVSKLSGLDLLRQCADIDETDALLIAACAPCQPFSAQNRTEGPRPLRTMIRELDRIVEELEPDFVFSENVPGIRGVAGYSAFRRFLKTLDKLRYRYEFKTVDAREYGVPQSRRRLVLLASKLAHLIWPTPDYGPGDHQRPYKTVREAIGHFPPITQGAVHPLIPNHVAARITDRNLRRLSLTPKNGGSRSDWPKDVVLDCHASHDGHPDVYGRLNWETTAPTLTCRCTSISNGRYGHPEQDRAISVREAAALQTFEDGYVFHGSLKSVSRQIGNAVPPVLANRFASVFTAAATPHRSGQKMAWRKLVKSIRSRRD